jgi:hypothetical protein
MRDIVDHGDGAGQTEKIAWTRSSVEKCTWSRCELEEDPYQFDVEA